MGWAARTKYVGKPKHLHPARAGGARVIICAYCQQPGGQKKSKPLVFVGVLLGLKLYAHTDCRKKMLKEAHDAAPKP